MNSLPKLLITANPQSSHRLILLPVGKALPAELPERDFWQKLLRRKGSRADELAKDSLVADLPDGARAALVMIDGAQSRFARLTLLRKAVMPLIEERPKTLALLPCGVEDAALADALYVALVNGVPLPQQKKKMPTALKEIVLPRRPPGADFCIALARANLLARELTTLVHGPTACEEAVRASEILFGGSLEGLSEAAFAEIAGEVPTRELDRARLDGAGASLLDLLVTAGLCASKGQARKDVEGGGIYLNNVRETSVRRQVTAADLLFGKHLLLRKGKRNYVLLTAR